MFNNKLIRMNYRSRNTLRVLQLWGSACFQQLENYQRRGFLSAMLHLWAEAPIR